MGTGVENHDAAAEMQTSAGGPGEAAHNPLSIRLLGTLAVLKGGDALPLPRSRKCRALIAYLAATGRPQRREHLCELLWEVPDDPKGELRWTLSKIRRVLGDALVADRDSIALDPRTAEVDLVRLQETVSRLSESRTHDLESLAQSCGQSLAEDVDLPRCPEFQSWLLAVRGDARQAQLAILGELARRFEDDPNRALPYVRARVACDPLNEEARIGLLEMLVASGRADEAEQQREIARALFEHSGIGVPTKLTRPLRANEETAKPAPQRIHFCTAPDGTRIAYSAVGSGPPLVKTANWMSHLEFEWESPLLRHWLTELSRQRRLIRYDARGNGLSDRKAADLSLDAFVADLETVAATIDEESFDLLGISQGCAVAIAYAVKHPQKVRKLVLFGGFATGWQSSGSAETMARWEAMITLAGLGWGKNNPAFRQMFTSLFAPKASPEQADWFNELQRASATPEEAQRLLRAIGHFDVSDMLPRVQAPTIIFHCRDDALVLFAAGRHLAATIPNAQFVGLDSDNHLPLEDEPAWPVLVRHLRSFLD